MHQRRSNFCKTIVPDQRKINATLAEEARGKPGPYQKEEHHLTAWIFPSSPMDISSQSIRTAAAEAQFHGKCRALFLAHV
jgi:hypothetical protein